MPRAYECWCGHHPRSAYRQKYENWHRTWTYEQALLRNVTKPDLLILSDRLLREHVEAVTLAFDFEIPPEILDHHLERATLDSVKFIRRVVAGPPKIARKATK